MRDRKEIKNSIDSNLYSLEVYPVGYFNHFDAKNIFLIYFAMEVSDLNEIPSAMEALIITKGITCCFYP